MTVTTVSQHTVPIPGEILKTTVIFGLTFDEVMVLAAMPLVLVLPSAMIDAIPLWVSLATVAVGFLGVLGVVFKTPKGQSPVEWFPAYLDRLVKPQKYRLKPKDQTKDGAPKVKYVNVFHTAELVGQEDEITIDEVEELIAGIENAEKIRSDDSFDQTDPSQSSSFLKGLFPGSNVDE